MKSSKLLKPLMLAGMIAALSACGDNIEGTFENDMGMGLKSSLTFDGDETVLLKAPFGVQQEIQYKVKGDEIHVFDENDESNTTQVMTIAKSGNIDMAGTLFVRVNEE